MIAIIQFWMNLDDLKILILNLIVNINVQYTIANTNNYTICGTCVYTVKRCEVTFFLVALEQAVWDSH